LPSYLSSVAGLSLCLASAFAAAPSAFGKAPDGPRVEAQLLDQAALLCDNCFFGAHVYYFCLAADNKVLIGYQRVPVVNWWDKTKNYLTYTRPSWTEWAPPGGTFSITYDDKHIWVDRPDVGAPHGIFKPFKESNQVRLVQNYRRDIFSANDRCREAVRAKGH